MKRVISLLALVGLLGFGCKKVDEKTASPEAAATAPAASKPAPTHGVAKQPAAAAGMSGKGKVKETMNAGGYTYVLLDGSTGEVWAAAPVTTVKVGDEVSFAGGMPMENFPSKTLGRTFELVYFVPGLTINGQAPGAAAGHGAGAAAPAPAPAPKAPPAQIDFSAIKLAEGGSRIEQVFADKAALSGKEVTVRGVVVKYNGGILGRNWIHIQDGSGKEGTNDLTVTTDAAVEMGATIVIKGTLGLDKDFGGGYTYGVIVENATVTVE